jgi:hypothetical protein
VAKPILLSIPALLAALLLARGTRAALHRSSAMAFYLLAAVGTWTLTLGPTITFMGEQRGFSAPFAWLMAFPGLTGLRVPARFWLLTTLCLATVAPSYYPAVLESIRSTKDELFDVFRGLGDLHVVVSRDAPGLEAFAARQPGAVIAARSERFTRYLVPRGPVGLRQIRTHGERLPVHQADASCWGARAPLMLDGLESTRWDCGAPQNGEEEVLVDLGRPATIGAVVNGLGPDASNFPRHLIVETSLDKTVWAPAWEGDTVGLTFSAAFADPRSARIVIPLAPRQARFVRLRQTAKDPVYYWSIAELEIWSASGP